MPPCDAPAIPIDTPENRKLVGNIARDFLGRGLELEDLVQEGMIGLMRAAELFDPDRGTKFTSYARPTIKGSIRKAIQQKGRPIRVPANLHAASLREADPEDLPSGLRARRGAAERVFGLTFVGDHSLQEGSLADVIPDPRHASPSLLEDIAELFSALPPRDAKVLSVLLGLDGEPALEPGAAAEAVGLTVDQVIETRDRVLEGFRRELYGPETSPPEEPATMEASRLNGCHQHEAPAHRNGNGQCHACGRRYGRYRRCYNRSCSEYTMKPKAKTANAAKAQPFRQSRPEPKTATPKPKPRSQTAQASVRIPPEPKVRAQPSALFREIDAMRSIAITLSSLHPEAVERIVAWLGGHFGHPARVESSE